MLSRAWGVRLDAELIESIAEATDIPLNPLARLGLKADNFVHRARLAARRRLEQSFIVTANPALKDFLDRHRKCLAAILSDRHPAFLVPIGGARPLWMVEGLSSLLQDQPVLFLLLVYWSVENEKGVEWVRRSAELHRSRFPRHSLIFLCNTPVEQQLLSAAGLDALFVHQNQIVLEDVFRPLSNRVVSYDAVYNAKIARFKRHYLASAIERVLYVAFRCPMDMSRSAGRAYVQRMLARSPEHKFANPFVGGLPSMLSFEDVNRAYNQASVGLCLSPVEGVEYLLAGLAVVSTPSRGGRDVFFDPEFCLTAEPDAVAVHHAVVALRERAIPPHIIRERTLSRIEFERRRSLLALENALERHGIDLQAGAIWPPPGGPECLGIARVRDHVRRWRPVGSST
jgi:hypothetical protein